MEYAIAKIKLYRSLSCGRYHVLEHRCEGIVVKVEKPNLRNTMVAPKHSRRFLGLVPPHLEKTPRPPSGPRPKACHHSTAGCTSPVAHDPPLPQQMGQQCPNVISVWNQIQRLIRETLGAKWCCTVFVIGVCRVAVLVDMTCLDKSWVVFQITSTSCRYYLRQ